MGKTQEPRETTPDGPSDRYLVPGLMRGLQVLKAFSPERPVLSLSEIAQALGVSRSAAFRSVYTLTQLGYLLPVSAKRGYRLGPALLQLGYGYLADRELVEIALPELEQLRDEIDWSTHLGLRDGARVLYAVRVPSRLGMGSIVHVGSRLPAALTSMGRVLLADLDEATIVSLHRDEQDRGGPRLSMESLLDQWRSDRSEAEAGRDVITQLGRFEVGIAAVAAPVRDLSGRVVAAINATRQLDEADAVGASLKDHVAATARRFSAQLGYQPPD